MKGIQEYYDKTAKEWEKNGYSDEACLPALPEFLSFLPKGGRVLDLCCGAGYESMRMKAMGFDVTGLDFSKESLNIARLRNPDIPFYQGDMLEDYTYIGEVDGILCSAGLVHVQAARLKQAFMQMAKVLRSGGWLLASVREGIGKMDDLSLNEIDGELYDRGFIAHTLEELQQTSAGLFSYQKELSSDMPVWHYYLFMRE